MVGRPFIQYTSGSTALPKGVVLTHANLLANSELIKSKCYLDGEFSGVSWLPPYHDMGLIGGVLQPLYLGRPTVLMSPMDFLAKPLRWLPRSIISIDGSKGNEDRPPGRSTRIGL